MRKILLATSALVAFAGAAQAAESPIQVTVGGSVDFRAALFHESENSDNVGATPRRSSDFQTEYRLNVAADGKAAGGIEYGAKISLYNGEAVGTDTDGADTDVRADQAYVYMSGAWGKILMGDEHGATDLFTFAPTVGEGQINGSYTNFTDPATLAVFQPCFADATENNTKATYYTPKVGNANHKVQLGVSYTPNPEQGAAVNKYDATSGATGGSYRNQIEATIQYTGTIKNVNLILSPLLATGEGDGAKAAAPVRDYTLWGIGGQAAYAGFTFGASFVDAGKFGTTVAQDKQQDVLTLGLKYEFDKVAMAVNYMNGEGYFNGQTFTNTPAATYIDDFSAYGVGATYTWFPGLTTAADAVFFDQKRNTLVGHDKGHVLMLSQKMTF